MRSCHGSERQCQTCAIAMSRFSSAPGGEGAVYCWGGCTEGFSAAEPRKTLGLMSLMLACGAVTLSLACSAWQGVTHTSLSRTGTVLKHCRDVPSIICQLNQAGALTLGTPGSLDRQPLWAVGGRETPLKEFGGSL